MRIFSVRQINFTAIIAGPLPAAYLLAKNYQNSGLKRASLYTLLLGYLFAILVYGLTIFIVGRFVIGTGVFTKSLLLGYALAILVLFSLQLIIVLLFAKRIRRDNEQIIDKYLLGTENIYSFVHALPYFLAGVAITLYLFTVGPFWFRIFAIYLLPNVFLYHHIKKAFVSKRSKILFTLIFTVLVSLFPIMEIFHDSSANEFLQSLLVIGYYYLAILLYSFLLYLLFDFILLFNKKVKFISGAMVTNQKFRLSIFGVIMSLSVIITMIGVYNYNNTSIFKYSIEVPKKSSEIEHLKIAMAADFHFSEITSKYFMRQFIKKINSIDADIVLLAGDIVESNQKNDKMKYFEEQLREIKSKYGVYAVEGNHDLYNRRNSFSFIENANIQVLRDTVIIIDHVFQIIGRRDRHDKNRKSIQELVESAYDSLPVLLLDHQPYHLDSVYNSNIDIAFSGHTHHGQLFPFNFITEQLYELSWGHRKIKNTHFFVTCGAQGWGPQVKTASQSEIMEIDVEFY